MCKPPKICAETFHKGGKEVVFHSSELLVSANEACLLFRLDQKLP